METTDSMFGWAVLIVTGPELSRVSFLKAAASRKTFLNTSFYFIVAMLSAADDRRAFLRTLVPHGFLRGRGGWMRGKREVDEGCT